MNFITKRPKTRLGLNFRYLSLKFILVWLKFKNFFFFEFSYENFLQNKYLQVIDLECLCMFYLC